MIIYLPTLWNLLSLYCKGGTNDVLDQHALVFNVPEDTYNAGLRRKSRLKGTILAGAVQTNCNKNSKNGYFLHRRKGIENIVTNPATEGGELYHQASHRATNAEPALS